MLTTGTSPKAHMQPINPTLPPTPAVGPQTAPSGIASWKVGQVLQAMTLSDTRQGAVTLQIGAQRLDAQTPIPLKAGTPLQLEVVRAGEQPLLRLLPATPPPANPEQQALRQALPRQAPLPPLLANLTSIARSAAQAGSRINLPAPVVQQAQAVLNQITQATQILNPSVLREAIQQAGVFLEARLARQVAGEPPTGLGKDLKAGLLKLQQVLESSVRAAAPSPTPGSRAPTAQTPAAMTTAQTQPQPAGRAALPANLMEVAPPLRHGPPQAQAIADASLTRIAHTEQASAELLRQVDGALARIQLNQLASVPTADNPQAWLLELPLRQGQRTDLLHLRIEADGQHGRAEGQPPTWSVTLAFDFPELGPVHARVQVAGDQVSTVFWAEQPGTAQLFTDHLDLLGADLTQSGLRIGQLHCHAGRPPPSGPSAPVRLLEERA